MSVFDAAFTQQFQLNGTTLNTAKRILNLISSGATANDAGGVLAITLPAGGGGGGPTALGKSFAIDAAGPSTGATGAFSGSLAFKTITASVAAVASGSTLIVSKGDYSAESPVTWTNKSLDFIALGSKREPIAANVQLPTLTPTASGTLVLTLEGVTAAVSPTNACTIEALDSKVDALGNSGSTYDVSGTSPLRSEFKQSSGSTAAVQALTAVRTTLSTAIKISGVLTLDGCTATNNIQVGGTAARITRTDMANKSVTFTGSPGVLTTDLATLRTISSLVNGTVVVIDDDKRAGNWWVDNATTIPTALQTGSFANPFKTVQQAADAIPSGSFGALTYGDIHVISVAPPSGGVGVESFTIADYKNLTIDAVGYPYATEQYAHLSSVDVSSHIHITFVGFTIDTVTCANSRLTFIDSNEGSVTASDTETTVHFETTKQHAPGDDDIHYSVGNVSAPRVSGRGYRFSANVTITDTGGHACEFDHCEFTATGATLSFADTSGQLWLDDYTLASLRRNGVHLTAGTSLSTLRLIDAPITKSVSFTVGALSAAMTDVEVTLTGAKVGDLFVLSPTTRLAGVIGCDAACETADKIKVRFFGTTAGGTVTYTVRQYAMSGG